MTDLPENELLSAYLDGELTAAERAQVEQLLATSDSARQLLDELRTLSATVRSLPRQSLGEDLSADVMRVAERRMLTEESPDQSSIEDAPVPLVRSIFRRFARPRVLVWTTIILAVAIVLHINENRLGGPVGKASKEIARGHEELGRPAPQQIITAAPDDDGRTAVAESRRDELRLAETKDTLVEAAKPAKLVQAKGLGYVGSESVKLTTDAKTGRMTITLPAGESDSVATKVEGKVVRSTKASTATALSSSSPAYAPGSEPEFPIVGKPDSGLVTRHVIMRAPSRLSIVSVEDLDIDKDTLVVNCDVTPKAMKSRAFDKLLLANNIVWQQGEGKEAGGVVSPARATPPAKVDVPPADAEQSVSFGRVAVMEEEEAEEKEADGKDSKKEPEAQSAAKEAAENGQPSAHPGVDVILVEAAPAQVEATLAGLRDHPEEFPSVSVAPAPGNESQQSFSQYNRSADKQQTHGVRNLNKPLVAQTDDFGGASPAEKPSNSLSLSQAGKGQGARAAGSYARSNRGGRTTTSNQMASNRAIPQGTAERLQLESSDKSNTDEALVDRVQLRADAGRNAQRFNARQSTQNAQNQRNALNRQNAQNQPAGEAEPLTQRVLFVLRNAGPTETTPAAAAPSEPAK